VSGLRNWLEGLAVPVGIFGVNDFRARLLLDACQLAGIAIPSQAGVVGVDNNPMHCEFSQPGLTSIECDWYRVGFQAARTLHQMLQGQTPEPECRIPPREVVRRTSTAVTLAQDARLLKAVTYISDHVGEVFGVERLLTVSDVSRRKLEQLFRAEMRMSPYQYLCQRRIERARMLLEGRLAPKLRQISRLCGFRDPRRFRIVFQRSQGLTPAQYRRAAQQKMMPA